MMARVSQCFSKTLIADKYLLGYSNTCEHFNRFGGSVNPFRNTGKDGVYDVREEEQDHRDHQLVGMVAVRRDTQPLLQCCVLPTGFISIHVRKAVTMTER